MTDFVSLHNQTDYSILDSIASVKDLFARAKELGHKAIAITDHGTLASSWDALKVSRNSGVKLIIGCECYFRSDLSNKEEKLKHVVLLAKNATGYKNLLTINKKAFDQGAFLGKRIYPIVDWDLMRNYADGLICLTACGNGIISQYLANGKFEEAEKTLLRLREIFGDNLGVEIQANNMERGSNAYCDKIDQKFLNRKLIELAKKHEIKIVPSCNTHYVKKEENKTHDILLAIGSHQPVYSNFRLKYPIPEFYLKSGEEVKNFFARNHGEEFAEQICQNSIYFSDLCEVPDWIDPKFSNPSGKELPVFPVNLEPDYEEFREWCKSQSENVLKLQEDSLYLRYKIYNYLNSFFSKRNFSEQQRSEYISRVEEELDVLDYCGVSSYMLIVADYINWSKRNGISTGPGRGSVGGCFIAFLLGIHDADSIKYGLVFPRFHNKIKKAYSDIDADFSKQNRHRVLEYIVSKYGEDNVAHVSNLNTITPKVYARDIARACELGGSKEEAVKIGNMVADSISSDIHSIDDALLKAPLFAEYCKKYPELEANKSISGKYRAWGTHAAGLIIGKRSLTGLVPVRKDKDGNTAIEFDKDTAEEAGLVKMDILGLSNLDIIDSTIDLIKKNGKEVPNIDFEAYDKETYDLISRGDTFGVFQFGTSAGTIELCKKIKPTSMEDLAIITTLARPASKEIREEFIKVREGKKAVKLLHPLLKRAFEQTYGFPLYDESLLILAKDVAGWDLDEADKLRKLTKEKGKNPEKVKKWRAEFLEGCIKNGLTEEESKMIWEQIVEPFGKYSFNKSHAVLYSIISYKTAYLKAHFPIEFLMANLMSELNSNTQDADSNIQKIKKELKERKVDILPPDLNKSEIDYVLLQNNQLLTGLNALKFVSQDAIDEIVSKRPFKNFFDFMVRVDSKKVRSNAIQALAVCGCMDNFNIPRKSIYFYCSDYRKKLQVWLKKHDPNKEEFSYPWNLAKDEDWKPSELYALEFNYLGEAFSCKPAEAYGKFFKGPHKNVLDIKRAKNKDKIYPIRAIVKEFFEFKVKKETSKYYGQSMIKAVIEDANGDQCGCTIFPDRWQAVQKRLKDLSQKEGFKEGIALNFLGNVNVYEDEIGVILEELFDLAPIPSPPSDLKAKKVNLKEARQLDKTAKENKTLTGDKNVEVNQLVEEIEDSLYDEGLIDLDEDVTN